MRVPVSEALRLACAGLAASFMLGSMAAASDSAAPGDVKTIENCLAGAAKAKSGRESCIGRVFEPCLDHADSTADMNACSDREFRVWDARLNRDYARLLGMLDASAKQPLKDIERLFIAMRDKKCQFDYVANGGGTMWSVAGSQCAVEETARQALWLADKIDMLASH